MYISVIHLRKVSEKTLQKHTRNTESDEIWLWMKTGERSDTATRKNGRMKRAEAGHKGWV